MDFHCRSRSPHSTVHVTSLIMLFLTVKERPSHYAISLVLTCARLCQYINASKKKIQIVAHEMRSSVLEHTELKLYSGWRPIDMIFLLKKPIGYYNFWSFRTTRIFVYEHCYWHGSTWTVFKTVHVEQFGPLNKTFCVVHRTRLHFCLSSTGQFEGIMLSQ